MMHIGRSAYLLTNLTLNRKAGRQTKCNGGVYKVVVVLLMKYLSALFRLRFV